MVQTSGFAGTLARAAVYSPTGVFLGTYTAQTQGVFTAANAGTHTIKVAAANFVATGDYSVGLTCLSPASPPPVSVACGDVVASSIDTPGEADLYSVDLQAGDLITVAIAQSAGFPGAPPYLRRHRGSIPGRGAARPTIPSRL